MLDRTHDPLELLFSRQNIEYCRKLAAATTTAAERAALLLLLRREAAAVLRG
jgi:hypothetical protein